MMEQKQGLKNFCVNIEGTMLKIRHAVNNGEGKPAPISYHEQYDILQFYLEVVDYLSKED
jgi:hypothetical protein